MKQGLTDYEFFKIKNLIKRRVPLNDAIKGKIKKIATAEELSVFQRMINQYGEPIELSDEDIGKLNKYKNQSLPFNEYLKSIQSKYLTTEILNQLK